MSPLWVLDLDNTLYPAGNGLFRRINERIVEYLALRLGLAGEEGRALQQRYREAYGLTVIGLMKHHGVDPDEYSRFVHDVPLEELLAPDPALGEVLEGLGGPKVVFTNGSVAHAEAVLGRLGVRAQVGGIFDLAFMDYVPKPQPHGYRKLLAALGEAPAGCWLVDDVPANLDTARDLGMQTVLVGPSPQGPHRHVRSVLELRGLVGGGEPIS
ncbi:MAG: pyrimidine 5'-nucleotidase [Deltaproteobacteria bacterium]|nr:pyrimidine 5'-nucleotidase [Deltaproteobacteria bacterium]